MRYRWTCVVAVVAAILLPAMLHAAEMTARDVITLKQLNYTDAEVLAAVAKAGGKVVLTDAEVAELKAAGGGDDLIKALRNPPKEVTVQDAVKMVKDGKPVGEVIDAIAASPKKPALTAEEAVQLVKDKVPAPIILALKGKPLGTRELTTLAEAKAEAPVYDKLVKMLGFEKREVPAEDALALTKAGVPQAIVKQYRDAGAAPVRPETPPVRPPDPPQPLAAGQLTKDDLVGEWQGRMVSALFTSGITYTFNKDDTYLMVTQQGILQKGRWSLEGKNLVMEPEASVAVAYPYEFKNGTLTAKGQYTSITITKKRE